MVNDKIKQMRRINIFVFCHILIFLGTNTIQAQMHTFEMDGINYRVIQEPDGTMTIGTVSVCPMEYGEYEGDIVIPNSVKETDDQYADKYKVIGIDNRTFAQTKYLKSVKLPPSIETIGDSTFFLSSVVQVELPMGNLKVIGKSVFEQSKLDSIDIPSNVKVIEENAFSNCIDLKSVVFHDGLMSIGNRAFHTCINLETIQFPNTLKSIGNEAFYYCIRLAIVAVGDKLKSIGSKAFFSCGRMRSFNLPDGIREIGPEAFQNAGIVEIVIPPSIKVIKESCFSGSMLRRVTLPQNLSTIEDYAFAHCRLDTLIVSTSTSVSQWVFVSKTEAQEWIPRQIQRQRNGSRNMSFNIPEGKEYDKAVSKLEKNVGKNNKITVDYSSGDIEFGANVHLIKVKDLVYHVVSYPTKGEEYGLVVVTHGSLFRDWTQIRDWTRLGYFLAINLSQKYASGHVKIPEVIEIVGGPYPEKYIVAGIGNDAFFGHFKVTCIDIPASVGTFGIGESAFSGTSISEIKLPENMEVIPSGLLLGTKIDRMVFPKGVKIIESSAFCDCEGLTSITIPSTVTKIGDNAFSGCTKLTSITIPKSVSCIGHDAFKKCYNLKTIILPDGITTINNGTFRECSALNSITIPKSVTSIGDYAFYHCSGLGSVTIPNSVTSIGDYAFSNCSGLGSVTIPNSVTIIGDYAFSNCSRLGSMTIPNSVTSIRKNAFNKVRHIEYDGNATGSPWGAYSMAGTIDGDFVYSDESKHNLIAYIGSGVNVTIPNSVTSIGDYAFSNCIGLKSVTIPNSVTTIKSYTFYNCSGLSSVTIPNSVTSIWSKAFEGCVSLTSIVIPCSVNNIGEAAFRNCSKITSITLSEGVKRIGDEAFLGCAVKSIEIPSGIVQIGRKAF